MKPRPDNVLAHLPDEQLEQLHQWIDAGHTQAKIVALLTEQFGVRTHKTSVRRYCCKLDLEERNLDASLLIESLRNAQPEEFDQAAVADLKYKLYKLATSDQSDTVEFARLFRLRLRMKDQEFARERFEYNVAEIALKHARALRDIAHDSSLETKEKRRAARLELFGVLTNQEEPITHEKRNGNPVADPSQNLIEPQTNGSPTAGQDQIPPATPSGPLPYCVLAPRSPHETQTNGDPVLIAPEKSPDPAPSFPSSPSETPAEEPFLVLDPTRDYKVKPGRDVFGEYLQYEYHDGNNPHGADTKYVLDHGIYPLRRRPKQ
jgi:hypothetical protein